MIRRESYARSTRCLRAWTIARLDDVLQESGSGSASPPRQCVSKTSTFRADSHAKRGLVRRSVRIGRGTWGRLLVFCEHASCREGPPWLPASTSAERSVGLPGTAYRRSAGRRRFAGKSRVRLQRDAAVTFRVLHRSSYCHVLVMV